MNNTNYEYFLFSRTFRPPRYFLDPLEMAFYVPFDDYGDAVDALSFYAH